MTLIQFILLFSILLLITLYFRFLKSTLFKRLIFLLIFVLGVLGILFPELTNKFANLLGVGRGADLLLYLMVVVFYFGFFILYKKIEKIEEQQTQIIREMAIKNVRKANDGKK